MANFDLSYIIKLMDKFTAPSREIVKAVDELDKRFGQLSNRFSSINKSLIEDAKYFSARFTAPIMAIGGYALKNAFQFEQMELRLRAVSSSAKEAEQTLNMIKGMSMQMPLPISDLAEAAAKLKSIGVTQDEMNDKMRRLSILAVGAQMPISEVANVFSRAFLGASTNFRQLLIINKRIPIIEELHKMVLAMGKTEDQWKMMLSHPTGLVNAKYMQQAFYNLTKEGGAFYETFLASSNTAEASLTRMHNTLRVIGADIGAVIMGTTGMSNPLKSAADKLVEIEKSIKQFTIDFPEASKAIVWIGAGLAALGPFALLIRGIIAGFALLFSPIGIAIAGISFAIYEAFKHSKELSKAWEWCKNTYESFSNVITDSLNWISDKLKYIYDLIMSFKDFKSVLNWIGEGIRWIGGVGDKKILSPTISPKISEEFYRQISDISPMMNSKIETSFQQGGDTTIAASAMAGFQRVTSDLNININDPRGYIKSTDSRSTGDVNFNLGKNLAFAR